MPPNLPLGRHIGVSSWTSAKPGPMIFTVSVLFTVKFEVINEFTMSSSDVIETLRPAAISLARFATLPPATSVRSFPARISPGWKSTRNPQSSVGQPSSAPSVDLIARYSLIMRSRAVMMMSLVAAIAPPVLRISPTPIGLPSTS